jgi:hypothetical protein
MSSITIEVPESVRLNVERVSAADGITMDQFFATAASEKLAVLEAAGYISGRAARADDAAFEAVLRHIPDEPVEEWDKRR